MILVLLLRFVAVYFPTGSHYLDVGGMMSRATKDTPGWNYEPNPAPKRSDHNYKPGAKYMSDPAPSSLEEEMDKTLQEVYNLGAADHTNKILDVDVLTIPEARSQLKQLILKDFLEMIGADEKLPKVDWDAGQSYVDHAIKARNQLRADLRQSARKRYQ